MDNTQKIDKKVILQAIGILCLAFLAMCTAAVTASLQLIGKMFPDIPYSSITLLETSPSLASIPLCIFSGIVAGRKISFRTLAIIGMAGYILFGALPFVMTNFTAILICRLLMGASLGLMIPLGNSLVILTLPQKMVSVMVGLNLVVQNIGILVLQNVANALVKISTPCVWLCYLIGLVPFIVMLFLLKDPKPVAAGAVANADGAAADGAAANAEGTAADGAAANANGAASADGAVTNADGAASADGTVANADGTAAPVKPQKAKLPGIVWPLGILLLFFCMFYMVSSSGVSEIVIGEGIGTVDDVTKIFNVNTIVSLVGGLAFGVIYKVTKKFTVYLGFILSVIGMLLFSFAGSISMMIICSIILSVGYTLCYSAFMMEINGSVPPAVIAGGSAILASLASLGVSFASSWYDLVQNIFQIQSMRIVMYASVGGLVLVTIVHLIMQRALNKACERNMANLS